MRPTYMLALAAALLVVSAAAYAADYCCPAQSYYYPGCPRCYNPAYDRTPICVQGEYSVYCAACDAGPCATPIDPWSKCGAFCHGGQIAPGWPYGWNSEYWLRPDSNF